MKKIVGILVMTMVLLGCAAMGPSVPPRVFDPVTMIPGEWPY